MINYEAFSEIEAILMMGLGFVAVLVIGQLLHRKLGVWAGHTRKFMHVGVGLVCVLFRYPFQNHWIVLTATLLFIGLLWATRRNKVLTGLHREDIQSTGDWLLPVAIFLNFLLLRHYEYEFIFYLPILILAISDPAAFYGGYIFKKEGKSIPGLVFFLITAYIITSMVLQNNLAQPALVKILLAFIIAVFGATAEFFSRKGWDNVTVPVAVGLILVLFSEYGVN